MIDLPPQDLTTIKRVLAKHVPECEVRAFGSRVSWTAKPHSDLDLVVVGKEKLSRSVLTSLKGEFEDSAMPVTVDLLDWNRISPEFRKNIEKEYETIQTRHEGQATPVGWVFRKVAEIADVIGGGTPKTKKPEYWGGNIPWLTPKDLSGEHPRYVSRGGRNITEAGLENSSARVVPPKTVLLTSRVPVGYVAIAKNPIATNQGFRSLVVNDENDPEFVYYLLLNNTDYLKQHAAGSTFQELSGGTLKGLEFLIPSLKEQKAIAHILGTLDDKIELNRRMNETLEGIARAIFKSWFIDFDPVHAKAEGRDTELPKEIEDLFPDSFEESELGEIPKGWNTGTIGSVVKCVGGSTPSTKQPRYWEGGTTPFVTPRDMSSLASPVVLDAERHITEDGVNTISSRVLPPKTVLLSSRAPVGYLAITQTLVCVNQGIIAMICEGALSAEYVLRWCEENMDAIKWNASGTTFAEISKRNFRPMPMIVPDNACASHFASIVGHLREMVVRNLRETANLVSVRDRLVPVLLSGAVAPGEEA